MNVARCKMRITWLESSEAMSWAEVVRRTPTFNETLRLLRQLLESPPGDRADEDPLPAPDDLWPAAVRDAQPHVGDRVAMSEFELTVLDERWRQALGRR